MATPAVLTLRSASEEDRGRLANLLHFETYVHRHLDWRRPLDWLANEPFLIVESAGRLAAALACPPDPPGVAWLRLFAVSTRTNPSQAWDLLWPAAYERLAGKAEQTVAIPLQDWFRELLAASDFEHTHNVAVLIWLPEFGLKEKSESDFRGEIRAMTDKDLEAVHDVDNSGFPPLWRHSLDTIRLAFAQSAVATVIDIEDEVVAYQISTISSQGLHLARLAVHPDWQGRHLALSLVEHLQQHITQYPEQRLTVNTQDINIASLGLYKKAGFQLADETYPVFQLPIS